MAGRKPLINHVSVRPSKLHGFGVFSVANYPQGTVMLESPIIVFQGKLPVELDGHAYYLNDGRAMPLGNGIFVNHARPGNVEPVLDLRRKIVKLVATRSVVGGAEITMDYGEGW